MSKQVLNSLKYEQRAKHIYQIIKQQQQTEQGLYLQTIRKELQKILVCFVAEYKDQQTNFNIKFQQVQVKLRQKSLLLQETTKINNDLKNENCILTLNLQLMQKRLKRCQFNKEKLLINVQHLHRLVAQKQALIKYLQQNNSMLSLSSHINLIRNKSATSINQCKSPRIFNQKHQFLAQLHQDTKINIKKTNFRQPFKNRQAQLNQMNQNQTKYKPFSKYYLQTKQNRIMQNQNIRAQSYNISSFKKKIQKIKNLSNGTKNSQQMTNFIQKNFYNNKQILKNSQKIIEGDKFSVLTKETKKSSLLRYKTQD